MHIENQIELHIYNTEQEELVIETNLKPKRVIVILSQGYTYTNVKLVKRITDLDHQIEVDEDECNYSFIESVSCKKKISLAKQKSKAKTEITAISKELIGKKLKSYISTDKMYEVIDSFIKYIDDDIDTTDMSKTQKCWEVHNELDLFTKFVKEM